LQTYSILTAVPCPQPCPFDWSVWNKNQAPPIDRAPVSVDCVLVADWTTATWRHTWRIIVRNRASKSRRTPSFRRFSGVSKTTAASKVRCSSVNL